MTKMCYSCCAPLENPEFQGPAAEYCKFCTNDSGKLKSRAEVQIGVAHWLKMWQPGLDDVKAMHRADLYLQAMPAWAE